MAREKKWKTYLVQTLFTSTVVVGLGLLISHDINLISDYIDFKKEQREIKATIDSLHQVIQGLSPEKLSELRQLYNETYTIYSAKTTSDSIPRQTKLVPKSQKIIPELTDLKTNLEWRQRGEVALVNDTVYVEDNTSDKAYVNRGSAFANAPQISINYFKYDGNKEHLKNFSDLLNVKQARQYTLYHELRHIDNAGKIIRVPTHERSRSLFAADELLANIAGKMGQYAQFDPGSQNWDHKYQTTVNIEDVNYILPGNSQEVVDSVITSAINELQGMPTYREAFIRNEGAKYDTNLDNAFDKDIPHAADAIQKMQSSFKINGKKTDIFNLASDRVRKLAQDFINSRDDDMRLVIKAHDYNVKL